MVHFAPTGIGGLDDASLSLTATGSKRPTHLRILQNRAEVAAHDLPIQRAARGERCDKSNDGAHIALTGGAVPSAPS